MAGAGADSTSGNAEWFTSTAGSFGVGSESLIAYSGDSVAPWLPDGLGAN
jgi:hypothetical protein